MPDQRPKVTVEDLLHLKRAERPDAAFWAGFERELRQKQLTALMEKRPWWQELPQFFIRRAYLPVGATAILAFTIVSVKYYAPTQSVQVPVLTADVHSPVDRDVAVAAAPVSSPLVNRSESAPAVEMQAAAAPAPAVEEEVVELMPLLVAPRTVDRPSSRLLAANFDQPDSAFADADATNRLSSPARVQTASAQTSELASVPTGQSRRGRLLAQYDGRQLNPEPVPPAVVRERLARRLGEAESNERGARMARDIDSFGTAMPQLVSLRF